MLTLCALQMLVLLLLLLLILDLILFTDPDLVSSVQITSSLGNSDHNMITFTVHYEHEVSVNARIVRDYHRGNYERIKAEL